MIAEKLVPTSNRWGSRGGWGMLIVGGLTIGLTVVGLGAVSWAVASGDEVEAVDALLTVLVLLGLLGWAVPAAVLGRRLVRVPQVDAGDVGLTVRDPALLTAPMVIPWGDVDRVEHLAELDPWTSAEGLNCSFTGVTGWPRPRFPNLLVRLKDAGPVAEARSGWLGSWPLAVLAVPSPYLMPRPSRRGPTRGFLLIVSDPVAVIERFATASDVVP